MSFTAQIYLRLPYVNTCMRTLLFSLCMLAALPGFTQNKPVQTNQKGFEVVKSDAEWKKLLTPEQYRVLRQKGTEYAFTGAYYDNHEPGTYYCAGCGNALFSSDHKFESGTGWPSFYKPIGEHKVLQEDDHTHGMLRSEVLCARCGGHLGHVFDDGPAPTGLRYCINSVSLDFRKK